MTYLTDAHIHLSDEEYASEILIIIRTMEKLRIRACCVSTDLSSSKKTLDLSTKSPQILPFIGLHPEKSNDDVQPIVDLLEKNSPSITGIGEIGLDKTYVHDETRFNRQKEVFEKLMEIAEKLRKPVSVHSRTTLDEIFSIIPSYSNTNILLHWFAGSKKQLRIAMDLGCYVSYGPAMIYANDKQSLLLETRRDRILVETDGPVRFSRCFSMKPAQITFLPSVVFCAVNVLKTDYDILSSELEQNSNRYLCL